MAIWHRFVLLATIASAVAFLAWHAPFARSQAPGPPVLTAPFLPDQTWRITCGYALRAEVDENVDVEADAEGGNETSPAPPAQPPRPRVCGHSGSQWNLYALDLQHAGGPAAAEGQPVLASADGRVSRAGWQNGFGWHVVLDHGGGYSTVYAHFREPPPVHEGDDLARGAVLGNVGCTGRCTGPHIHFALWKNGVSVLPEPICGERDLHAGQLLAGCFEAPGADGDGVVEVVPSSTEPPPFTPGADFDGDGRDDVVFLSGAPNGPARIDVLASNEDEFALPDEDGWWRADSDVFATVADTAAVDFDGDGRSDLALLFDEENCHARVRVLLASDASFSPSSLGGWWWSAGYCAGDVIGFEAGDYDGDGLADLALVARNAYGAARADVLRSDGSRFVMSPTPWWQAVDLDDGRPVHVVAADLDSDGMSDLAALYGFAGCRSYVRAFISTGSAFEDSGRDGWWQSPNLCSSSVADAAAGDFDGDGAADDVAFAYADESGTGIAVLRGDGGRLVPDEDVAWWYGFVGGNVLTLEDLLVGDFDADGTTDLAAVARDDACFARLLVLGTEANRFQASDWWSSDDACAADARGSAP